MGSGSAYNGFGKAVGTAGSGSYSNFGATDTFTDTNGYSLNGVAINNADASASSPHPPSPPPSHPPPPPPPPRPSPLTAADTAADGTAARALATVQLRRLRQKHSLDMPSRARGHPLHSLGSER